MSGAPRPTSNPPVVFVRAHCSACGSPMVVRTWKVPGALRQARVCMADPDHSQAPFPWCGPCKRGEHRDCERWVSDVDHGGEWVPCGCEAGA